MNDAVKSSTATALLWIKLHHATLRMLLRAGVSGPQRRFDACLGHFERIVALCAALLSSIRTLVPSVVSFEPGLVMCLYL